MKFLEHDHAVSLKKIFVLGGQVSILDEPGDLITILGSCVSVCLWDRETRVGGMNHFLLPETVNDSKSLNGGISSTRKLIQLMSLRVPNIKKLEARIFGGANRFFKEKSFLNVGAQNVEAAKIVLEESGINAVQFDVGGEPGRKIHFNTETGKIRIIKIEYEKYPL